jgi:AMP deaminase
MVKDFSQHLEFIFKPLITMSDSANKLLKYIRAFDSVDDETKDNGDILADLPQNLTNPNVPFSYYMYHMAINIARVNRLHGTALKFRPHCGEGGSVRPLLVCFMLADGISHGVNLKNSAVLTYMYYLDRMRVSMSMSSNNYLVAKSSESPFGPMFKYGIDMSLSTDDPLIFFEEEDEHACLNYEYTTAEFRFALNYVDLAEIARNSVMQSSYPEERIAEQRGVKLANADNPWVDDSIRTGVPVMRLNFRKDVWCCEISHIQAPAHTDPHNTCPDTQSNPDACKRLPVDRA